MAAGKGTRMKSELPKVLVPVGGKPMIEYVIDALHQANVSEIIMVVGYKSDLVRQELAKYPDLQFVEQTEQKGTGHAVKCCQSLLEDQTGPLFVIAGDSPMIQVDSIKKLFHEYDQNNNGDQKVSCILGTTIKENPTGMGRILRDKNNNFLGIVEEKDANPEQKLIQEINMSYYIFDTTDLFRALNEVRTNNVQNEYYITDVPGIMLQKNQKVLALPILHPLESLGVNTVEDLIVVEQAMTTK